MFIYENQLNIFTLCQKDYILLRERLLDSHTQQAANCFIIVGTLTVPVSKRLDEDFVVIFKYSFENIEEPNKPPEVFLQSHREKWLKGKNTHIESDWRLCLFPPGLSFIDYKKEHGILRLLETLSGFLCREYNYQKQLLQNPETAKWPGKEFSHGKDGITEAKKYRSKLKDTTLCYCGSGIQANKCRNCY